MSTIATQRSSALRAKSMQAERALKTAGQASKRKYAAVERGDLLAIPLCILWGIGWWSWPFGSGFIPSAAQSGQPLSFLWELPLTVARFLFGW